MAIIDYAIEAYQQDKRSSRLWTQPTSPRLPPPLSPPHTHTHIHTQTHNPERVKGPNPHLIGKLPQSAPILTQHHAHGPPTPETQR